MAGKNHFAIAAVVPNETTNSDETVAGFAIAQINRGWRIRGLIQEVYQTHRSKQIRLVALDDGSIYPISQFLGTHSVSCRIDLSGIAEASATMRRIAINGADLAIFNRFSTLEAHGHGFAAEMLDLMSRQIPVLTIVPPKHLPAWRRFTGHQAVELPPDQRSLLAWFADLSARRSGFCQTSPAFSGARA
uniref:Molybdenum ABC transporter ATP-binding protein n=1 Tax=Dechloromonas aromatica (strain RCB) TaxID=159087 RepID=Q47G03_DECAR